MGSHVYRRGNKLTWKLLGILQKAEKDKASSSVFLYKGWGLNFNMYLDFLWKWKEAILEMCLFNYYKNT